MPLKFKGAWRLARILPFRPKRRHHEPDRVDEDGFIIDDDEDGFIIDDDEDGLLTYPFGRPFGGLEMDFERGVSATLTISVLDVVRELERGPQSSVRHAHHLGCETEPAFARRGPDGDREAE